MANISPDGFVELDRTFSNFLETADPEQAAFDSYYSAVNDGGTTWEKLLKSRCVVILAEAGSGKTWELKSQAQTFRDAGQIAFFIPLESLAQKPLPACLTQEDNTLFTKWQAASDEAVFFLDAVDEAKLTTRRAFEKALRSFIDGITLHAHKRVRTVISSRITGWRGREDISQLHNLLNLPVDEPAKDVGHDDSEDTADAKGKAKTVATLRVVTLDVLTNSRVRTLAEHEIPNHFEEFLKALDDSDAWSFARRPQDVTRLAGYWKETGDLGGLTDLLEFDIRTRLQETDPDRQRHSRLSERQFRLGAEALAAAVIFGKTIPISLEGELGDSDNVACVIPSAELPDWTSEQRRDLLTRALFDPAAFGLVRFHHRSVADYLAACWLNRLFETGLLVSDAMGLFFVCSRGAEVLIPSRAAVACWLACGDGVWNSRIRKKLLSVAPDALLSQGDGEKLDIIETRTALIQGVAIKAGIEGEVLSDATNDQLKRLANEELCDVINGILLDSETSDDGRLVLLRIIREGALMGCVPALFDLVSVPGTSSSILVYIVAAVATAGNADDKGRLATVFLARPDISEDIACQLVSDFYPDTLSGEALVHLAQLSRPRHRFSYPDFSDAVSRAVRDHAPSEHIAPLIAGFLQLLQQRPGVTGKNHNISYLVSERFLRLTPVLRTIVGRALSLESIQCDMATMIVEAMYVIELAEEIDPPYESRKLDLNELSFSHPSVRRRFCWHKTRARALRHPSDDASIHDIYLYYTPFKVNQQDLAWLYEDLHSRHTVGHRKLALHLANSIWWYSGASNEVRAKIRQLISDNSELRRLFRTIFPDPIAIWLKGVKGQIHIYYSWKYREDLRKVARVFRRWRNFWQLSLDRRGVASGRNIGYLWHLFHTHPRSDDANDQHSPEAVRQKYGARLAAAYRDGCKFVWRMFTPQYPHEKPEPNTTDGRVSLGQLGILFDIEDGLNFQSLTPDDALRAARYAVEELNSFPNWFPELAAAHPEPVRSVLSYCIGADWGLEGDSAWGSGVGNKLYHAAPTLWRLMAGDLLARITVGDPAAPALLYRAVGVIIRGMPEATSEVVDLVSTRTAGGTLASPITAPRFVIWLWLNAHGALDWLEELSASEPAEVTDSFLLAVGSELGRETLHTTPTDSVPSYHSPSYLRRLACLLYRHVRPEDDIDRYGTGTYSPGPRDRAQELRFAILSRLEKTPGAEAHDALIALAEVPELAAHRIYVLRAATLRRQLDVEPNVWHAGDAAKFARTNDQPIRSGHDICALAIRRFAMLKDDLEDADFRRREGLPVDGDEDRLQEWVARYLDERSADKYAVVREAMVAYKKKPDIRLEFPPHTPTCIEIKWVDDCSYAELCEALSDQLVGRYMRARRSRHGILLLAWRGKKKCWQPTGEKRIEYSALLARLNEQAGEILGERLDVDGLTVVGLNFSNQPT